MTRLLSGLRLSFLLAIVLVIFLTSLEALAAPRITALSPSSVKAGSSAFTLSVQGANFSTRTFVYWNSSRRTTHYVNSSTLTASITAADVQQAGQAKVGVYNTHTHVSSNVAIFTITSATSTPLSISTSTLPNGAPGNPYSAGLAAKGGVTPYNWKVISGQLPAGLGLSTSGSITGTPTAAGESIFGVEVTDSAASPQAATTSMAITIGPAKLAITTAALTTATSGAAYKAALAATGGTQPYTWSITSGQLPSGLTFSSAGVISGTTTTSGTFPITARVSDQSGQSATGTVSLIVAAQTSTGFTRFYAATSFWNTPIPTNPTIDSNSATIISTAIVGYASSANFANSDDWGIALAFADGSSKNYTVQCTMYCTGDSIVFPIPAGAHPTTGSDHHLAVVNGNQELDMWLAAYNANNDTWSAGTRTVEDVTGWGAACAEGQHCNGAVAAGFDLLGGAVRPEEIQQGHIDHALSITTPATRAGYIACPATHTDGASSSSSAIPEGARIQLDPNFNVDAQSWPAWEKIVAKALQTYGAYVSDTGGSLAIRGVADMNLGSKNWAWANTPKGASLSNLPWSQFRVLQLQSCN